MTTGPALDRRARLRARTAAEIKAAARELLAASGPDGVQLRAVARAIGVTAPALYRYFPSREDLVDELTVDLYDELLRELEVARDARPRDDLSGRLHASSHAFRDWAVARPQEFRLLFASPPGTLGQAQPDRCEEAAGRFGSHFAEQFREVWARQPFPVPADGDLPTGLSDELDPYWTWLVQTFGELPKGAVVSFVTAWVRLYGLVAMEVLGHLAWAVRDGGPLLEQLLREIDEEWGIGPAAGGPRPGRPLPGRPRP